MVSKKDFNVILVVEGSKYKIYILNLTKHNYSYYGGSTIKKYNNEEEESCLSDGSGNEIALKAYSKNLIEEGDISELDALIIEESTYGSNTDSEGLLDIIYEVSEESIYGKEVFIKGFEGKGILLDFSLEYF